MRFRLGVRRSSKLTAAPAAVLAVALFFGLNYSPLLPNAYAQAQPQHQTQTHDQAQTKMHKPPDPSSTPIVRLSRDVLPRNYDLTIEPDLKRFTFSGQVEVTLDVTKPVYEIVLNAADMKITEARLTRLDPATCHKEKTAARLKPKIVPDPSSERVRFVMTKPLLPGDYKLSCKFSAPLNDKLVGFYRSSFQDDKHEKHWLCATQLEPMDGRRMFPCFDEPNFKASFSLKVTIPSQYTAISNGAIEKTEQLGDKQTITFEPTPKMSSYLFALVVGEFKLCGEKTVNGVPIRVWAVPGKEHLGSYALEEAAKIFAYESEYFGVPYPGKKLDLISIPDFSSEGMENLGAITFNEAQFLMEEESGSINAKKDITNLLAHEIAHQWFGDLVTMHWWDALWLNEAFATWMATRTADALHPEWRVFTESVINRGGMSTDALVSTRAIHADVRTEGEVNEMFDSITYDKGESVLRMLETYVGHKSFRDGVHKYLTDHAFGNATTEDLWKAIAACSQGAPVEAIMKSFIYLPGVPIVKVDLTVDGQSLKASQLRYFMLGEAREDKSNWEIPLVIRPLQQEHDQAGTLVARVLTKKEDSISLPESWPGLVVNAGGTGYYHTQYSEPLFLALKKNFASLTVEEKLIAMSDVNALTLSGRRPVEDSYDFVLRIKTEKDPLVLIFLVRQLHAAHRYMTDGHEHDYEKLVQSLVRPLKVRTGWKVVPDEDEAETRLREVVLELLGTYGQDKETINESSEHFDLYCKDHKAIDPNIVDSVMAIVSYNGDQKKYNQILKLYHSSLIPKDKERALFSLAGFRNKELATQTLNFAISNDVRLQDGPELINSVASKRETRPVAWPFIRAHWGQLVQRFPEDHLHTLATALGHVETREQEQEVKSWLRSHPIPHAKTAIARMEEEMNLQLLRKEKLGDRIRRWIVTEAGKLG